MYFDICCERFCDKFTPLSIEKSNIISIIILLIHHKSVSFFLSCLILIFVLLSLHFNTYQINVEDKFLFNLFIQLETDVKFEMQFNNNVLTTCILDVTNNNFIRYQNPFGPIHKITYLCIPESTHSLSYF